MRKNLLLIANPTAGKGQVRSSLFEVISVFTENGYAPTVYLTEKKGDAEQFARDLSPKFDMVVCIGGDGTLSETINGLMLADNPPPLGYIPMGTVNDFARTLKLHKNPLKAARAIATGTPTMIDVGYIGDKYFSYISAFGAFTEVSYSTPQDSKNAFGHLAYILEGMTLLTKITPCFATIEYDDGVLEGDFVFGAVLNSTSIAGLIKLPDDEIALNDGLFEIMLIKNPQNITDLSTIVNGIRLRNYDADKVILLHTKNIKFTFDRPVSWTRDGESGGSYTEIAATNCHCALNIIV